MTAHAAKQEPAFAEFALPIGTLLSDGKFRITGHLGAGGFGITYTAQDNVLGRTVVVKECFPGDFCFRERQTVVARSTSCAQPFRQIVKMFMREAQSLAKLRHPNIVGVHGAFEDFGTAYMVLDLIEGRDLADFMQPDAPGLSPIRVQDILLRLLDAVEKVHGIDLLHRDIAPDNIIIEDSGAPVLIDFGAARGEASRKTRAVSSLLVVKDGYSPQEFYVEGSSQSPASDLYALGATFYHLLSGMRPPHSQTRLIEVAGRKTDPCTPLEELVQGYEPEFLQAIDRAMQIHPSDRLQSAAQWKALITQTAPSPDLPQMPRATLKDISLDLEHSLTKLVEETNQTVDQGPMLPVEVRDAAPRIVQESLKPDWVDEFNRESLNPPKYEAQTPVLPLTTETQADSDSNTDKAMPIDPGNLQTPNDFEWARRISQGQPDFADELENRTDPSATHGQESEISAVSEPDAENPIKAVGPSAKRAGFRLTKLMFLVVSLSGLMLFFHKL